MDAKTKQALQDIQFKGRAPMIIEAADKVFIMDWVSKYSASGHVCGMTGKYNSGFKQVKIQKTKDGRRYIMADRVRFDADEIKPFEIPREIVERELAMVAHMKRLYVEDQERGIDVGYSIENQDFYIKNLTDYLERVEQHETILGSLQA